MDNTPGQKPQGEVSRSDPPTDVLSALNFPGGRDIVAFFQELRDQTDRGVAVLGASWIDWRVTEAIRSQLPVLGKPAIELLGKHDDSGNLDYQDKCFVAHCLGIVRDVGLQDLKHIGTIRNKFAHRIVIDSFGHDSIRQLCKLLQSPNHCTFTKDLPHGLKKDLSRDPRSYFTTTVHQLCNMLTHAANQLSQGVKAADLEDVW